MPDQQGRPGPATPLRGGSEGPSPPANTASELNPDEIDRMDSGTHHDPHAVLGAHPMPAASGWPATSTTGTAGATRCGPWAALGSGSCSCPRSATAPGTST